MLPSRNLHRMRSVDQKILYCSLLHPVPFTKIPDTQHSARTIADTQEVSVVELPTPGCDEEGKPGCRGGPVGGLKSERGEWLTFPADLGLQG